MNGLLDHGLLNQRYNEQLQNLKQGLLGQYIEGVKSRMSGLLQNPAKALYDAYSKQIGVNLDLPISEYAAMAQNPQSGNLDMNAPAMQEAMSWLPGPADNIAGLLGTIAGPKAKTAKLDLLEQAKALASKKVPADEIYQKTGWWLDHPDRVPRFEIDDSQAVFKHEPLPISGMPGTIYETQKGKNLSELMSHKQLTDAYPESVSGVSVGLTGNSGVNAYYDPETKIISLDSATEKGTGLFKNINIGTDKLTKQHEPIMMHELQHNIQELENMSRGGSADLIGMDEYRRLAGEADARLVQKRISLTPEQRQARPFYKEYDVPIALQIIRGLLSR